MNDASFMRRGYGQARAAGRRDRQTGADSPRGDQDLLPEGVLQPKISEIARQAGVADGTIYLYFKNKDDLLISVRGEDGEVVADIRAVSPTGRRAPRLQIFIRNHMDLLTREAGLIEDPGGASAEQKS
jgi:AcrR family transcriptional regulator